jgi:hypothetical protein
MHLKVVIFVTIKSMTKITQDRPWQGMLGPRGTEGIPIGSSKAARCPKTETAVNRQLQERMQLLDQTEPLPLGH